METCNDLSGKSELSPVLKKTYLPGYYTTHSDLTKKQNVSYLHWGTIILSSFQCSLGLGALVQSELYLGNCLYVQIWT